MLHHRLTKMEKSVVEDSAVDIPPCCQNARLVILNEDGTRGETGPVNPNLCEHPEACRIGNLIHAGAIVVKTIGAGASMSDL